jgi:hypothetical protein
MFDVEEDERSRLDHGGIWLAVEDGSRVCRRREQHARRAVRHSKGLDVAYVQTSDNRHVHRKLEVIRG